MFRTLSACNLTGSEQLAGMKEVADWRCLKLDAKTLPNSQQPKRKKTQNVSKKTNCLNCNINYLKLPQILSKSLDFPHLFSAQECNLKEAQVL